MKTKNIILLWGFLLSLSFLSAQRLQNGLSIGLPGVGHVSPLDIYYNRSSSSRALFEDVFQFSPAYSLTYAFAAKGRKQWFVKQAGIVEPYRTAENPWDYLSYDIRLGGGQIYYLPFAPGWQWQWELGAQVDRIWIERSVYDPLELYARWRKPLPYASINLQTTSLGKHLIAGVGAEVAARGEFGGLVENLYLVANLAWALKAREHNPVYEKPTLDDLRRKLYIQYSQVRYGSWDYYAEDYLTDMRNISGEYWWRFKNQWRLASRMGIGFSATGKKGLGIGYDWLLHVEQNAYLRIGPHLPILPFAGLGILGGQVWQESYEFSQRINSKKNLFRPYLKGGFRIQAPHHRIFAEFSVSTAPSFQAGIGVRLGR